MRSPGWLVAALLTGFTVRAACAGTPVPCSTGARAFYPCDLTFAVSLTPTQSNLSDDLLTVEFRSPSATTYLLHAFPSAAQTLRVRFTPTEPGAWTTRVTSTLPQWDGQQSGFSVAASASPGLVSVANLRHWKTTDKQPHLWLSAEVPMLSLDPAALSSFLESRKRDGFTHIRTTLLTAQAARNFPDFAYFDRLDQALLEVANRGFTVDLVLADQAFLQTGALHYNPDVLLRYVISRYAALNATWQGIEHFEDYPDARQLLRTIAVNLDKFDPYHHPRSSDAAVSSSPLLPDHWMNFLIEASPHPEVGAVEHQFTEVPQIHLVAATEPAQFRRELWNCTANGEYPTVSFASLRNEANVRAVQTWQKILSGTRHWEFEPYFDVSGARAVGLNEVEYIAYAERPGTVEISLPKHKYNPLWVNPFSGEQLELKDYKGEVFSQQTPDNQRDWLLQVPRNGHKESMKSYRFESVAPPVQEVEFDSDKLPFTLPDPAGDQILANVQVPYQIKLTRSNRATRNMQYLLWGEVVGGPEGSRLLATGPSGNVSIPQSFLGKGGDSFAVRLQAINANGKAYELDRVYQIR